jgi:hypothetical protein
MSIYALISNNTVTELFTPPAGFTLAQCFTPSTVARFVDVSALSPQPAPGWRATPTNGVWVFSAPVAAPQV